MECIILVSIIINVMMIYSINIYLTCKNTKLKKENEELKKEKIIVYT